MNITNTNQFGVDRLKIIVYGPAGAGKTRLAATTGDHDGTLIVSAESGLLSLRGENIDVAQVQQLSDLTEIYRYLRGGEHKYRWVILDSVSEIAEVCLAAEKRKTKDGRAAYGQTADLMFQTLRLFRDLHYHVVMTAKQAREQTESGGMLYGPLLPGKQLSQGIGYLVDEVFALRVMPGDDGALVRVLQTGPDGAYDAKDRSGALDHFEAPSLATVAAKIVGPAGAPTPLETSREDSPPASKQRNRPQPAAVPQQQSPALAQAQQSEPPTQAPAATPTPVPVQAAATPSTPARAQANPWQPPKQAGKPAPVDDQSLEGIPDQFLAMILSLPPRAPVARERLDEGRIRLVTDAWHSPRGASWRDAVGFTLTTPNGSKMEAA
jgi:phage nucleotide-binding protein